MCVYTRSVKSHSVTPWTVACQAPVSMKPSEDSVSWAATSLYGAFMLITKWCSFLHRTFSQVERYQACQVEPRFRFIPSAWEPYAVLGCYAISLIALFIISFSGRTQFSCCSNSLKLSFPIRPYHCRHGLNFKCSILWGCNAIFGSFYLLSYPLPGIPYCWS